MVNGQTDLSTYTFGKIPPQAKDAEELVLGACLLESDAVPKALSILIPESFYVNSHSIIFRSISGIYNSGKPVDLMTVKDDLQSKGKLEEIGGAFSLSELTNRLASGANVEHYAFIVAQKYIQREIIRVSSLAIKEAYEDGTDCLKLLDDLTINLINITSVITKNSAKHISKPSLDNLKRIEKMNVNPGSLLGYPTGLTELDKALHGIQPGVIVIAARPSMGKSALMAQILYSISKHGIACQIFTLEVNAERYELRMKSQLSNIHFERVQTGNIFSGEWEILHSVSNEISELPIWIDDCATLSMVQLRSKCLQAYKERDVRCFAIDFIQLAEGGHENEALTQMSRAVKMISQELNVPFIELSQLSREVEKRPDKKPMLSDLRNSGSLEQDADVVLLLYRPEYYGLKASDKNGNEVDNTGFAQLRVAKNKDGKVCTIDLKFIGENLKFKDYEKSGSVSVF